MSNDELRDSLMKGLHQFATRQVDDALAKRLLACVTCIEADPKDPASFDRLREQLDKTRGRAQNRRQPAVLSGDAADAFAPISRELGRTGMLKRRTARGGGWWSKSRSAPISLRRKR